MNEHPELGTAKPCGALILASLRFPTAACRGRQAVVASGRQVVAIAAVRKRLRFSI